MDIARTTTAGDEAGVGVEGQAILEARGWAAGVGARGGDRRLEGVASAAAAGVRVGVGVDGGMRLGETVWHCLVFLILFPLDI